MVLTTRLPLTIGTTAVQILGPNANRKSIRFESDGLNTVTLDIVSSPIAGQGVVLNPRVPARYLTLDTFGKMLQNPWYAIADLAGSLLTVYEETG